MTYCHNKAYNYNPTSNVMFGYILSEGQRNNYVKLMYIRVFERILIFCVIMHNLVVIMSCCSLKLKKNRCFRVHFSKMCVKFIYLNVCY